VENCPFTRTCASIRNSFVIFFALHRLILNLKLLYRYGFTWHKQNVPFVGRNAVSLLIINGFTELAGAPYVAAAFALAYVNSNVPLAVI